MLAPARPRAPSPGPWAHGFFWCLELRFFSDPGFGEGFVWKRTMRPLAHGLMGPWVLGPWAFYLGVFRPYHSLVWPYYSLVRGTRSCPISDSLGDVLGFPVSCAANLTTFPVLGRHGEEVALQLALGNIGPGYATTPE